MSNPIEAVHTLGQSLWYDNIQRRLIDNGELADLIARGDIRGITSNPTIFRKAIAETNDYDSALVPLAWSGWDAEQIFWQLAFEDIRAACDLFAPLFHESAGGDGYVSIEVSPFLAHKTEATIAQAMHLWEKVARPNLMVKIPATPECIPAIRASIAAGINVNITLIFSLARYREVMQAYLAGLDERLQAGLPVDRIASVASFFVSRMDTKVDKLLESIGSTGARAVLGKTAIAYTKLAYDEFRQVFGGKTFARFKEAGCRLQRPLWASTSTKNPAYPDTLYVDALIGRDTVDTVPPQTLDAFRDHGAVHETVTEDLDGARAVIAAVEKLGISMDRVTQELEDEGITTFADSFTDLLETLDERRIASVRSLRPLDAAVARRVSHLEADSASSRLYDGDPTLWTTDPQGQEEVRQRLGWLHLPSSEITRRTAVEAINFARDVHQAGFRRFLLLGMGGSSLAPEVMSLVFSPLPKKTAFAILDSTDPAQVSAAEKAFPPDKTLYLVSSKSGGTAEVNALMEYFWKRTGEDGSRFVAITDPGTTLESMANARGFRKTFLADPSVGGRYSALTTFGLVPAALMGIDLDRLLTRAERMAQQCAADVPPARNPGLVLGAVLGQAAISGRDKLTILADMPMASFGSWLEQLIAESSGKQGKGILPVDGEPVGGPESYGEDRLVVYLRCDGQYDVVVKIFQESGHPALVFNVPDPYDLGAEFYRWEVATAVACAVLRVNAFDQPDVQDSKDRTKAKIAEFRQTGFLEEGKPAWAKDGVRVFAPRPVIGDNLSDVIDGFLGLARKHDYIAINAYVPRNPETAQALLDLRLAIRAQTGFATTVGFGPRFLHSTGQLHKGGPDSGLFLQITVDLATDLEIPNQAMSFGTLERAQALGDYEALAGRGRRILRLHLHSLKALSKLADQVH